MRQTLPFLASTVVAVGLVTGCDKSSRDGVSSYTVPKEQPAQAPPASAMPGADSTMPASDIPVGSGKLTWTTPPTWQELAPTSIRIGNFVVHGSGDATASMAIFSFPGSVGTELGNVNRWRNELKLEPTTEDKVVSTPVTVDAIDGKLYDISSEAGRTVVASIPRGDATWFFKMWGDKKVVTDAVPAFQEFLKSVHFGGAGSVAQTAAPMDGAMPSTHPDIAGATGLPTGAPGDAPKFKPPSNWSESTPGPMILKSYVASNSGKNAKVTISFLGGTGGGIFANIGRWRGQLGLPPIDDDKAASLMQSLETDGGKATLVDFSGTDAKTGEAARLIAVIVPHGDNTWFYKLMGDGNVVEVEKPAFVKFVQAVHYP